MKHPNDRNPPAGAPVYYRGGKHGHIALSVGGGKVIRSTDCQSTGIVAEEDLSWPEQAWGYPYLGWTGDLSKVALPLEAAAGKEEIVKPTDVVGKDSDGTDMTMGEMSARLNWLYQNWLSQGALQNQLDRIEQAIKSLPQK